jgi:hypothetical protein
MGGDGGVGKLLPDLVVSGDAAVATEPP